MRAATTARMARLTEGVNMATIAKENDVVTLVNVFTVKPDDQDRLARLLVEATEKTMRHLPGFVSASIHKSFDGAKVINYAQWRSRKDFEALRDNQEARTHMDAAAALAKFEPMLCEVVDSISSNR
jgi:quinol monooxygenase YgiN